MNCFGDVQKAPAAVLPAVADFVLHMMRVSRDICRLGECVLLGYRKSAMDRQTRGPCATSS